MSKYFPKKFRVHQNQYQLIDILSEVGSSGTVLSGLELKTGNLFAFKFQDNIPAGEKFILERLMEKKLKNNINIFDFDDQFNNKGQQKSGLIIMELGSEPFRIKTFPLENRLNYYLQIANGIVELHSLGIAHGDLRIPNVIYSNERKLKICDTGSMRHRNQLVQSDSFGSSSLILPSEIVPQLRNQQIIDILALGNILFQLIQVESLGGAEFSQQQIDNLQTFPEIKELLKLHLPNRARQYNISAVKLVQKVTEILVYLRDLNKLSQDVQSLCNEKLLESKNLKCEFKVFIDCLQTIESDDGCRKYFNDLELFFKRVPNQIEKNNLQEEILSTRINATKCANQYQRYKKFDNRMVREKILTQLYNLYSAEDKNFIKLNFIKRKIEKVKAEVAQLNEKTSQLQNIKRDLNPSLFLPPIQNSNEISTNDIKGFMNFNLLLICVSKVALLLSLKRESNFNPENQVLLEQHLKYLQQNIQDIQNNKYDEKNEEKIHQIDKFIVKNRFVNNKRGR